MGALVLRHLVGAGVCDTGVHGYEVLIVLPVFPHAVFDWQAEFWLVKKCYEGFEPILTGLTCSFSQRDFGSASAHRFKFSFCLAVSSLSKMKRNK